MAPISSVLYFLLRAYVLPLALCAVIGYLLGSVNSSIILTRLFKNKADIRNYGSGNAGMTNVLRSVGKAPAALTFVGDFLKCVISVLLAVLVMRLFGWESGNLWIQAAKYIAGVACVVGHIFPLYYSFRGGKGIVTSAAMILMTDWRIFLLIIATFLIVFIWKRIVSLASIVCAAVYPLYTFLFTFFLEYEGSPLKLSGGRPLPYLLFAVGASLFIGVLVLIRHRSNIGRLRRGEEKPVAFGKKEKS